jgi:alpha-amylase/alpha-mannosidase (GH57 family)
MEAAAPRFPVVLLWHMHQPEYRVAGRFRLPWAYAHALKDYSDMAAHLEAEPGARAVINFSPVLLEQLDDYARRLERHERSREPIGDPLLDALVALPFPGAQRAALARLCLSTDGRHQLDRVPGYATLGAQLKDADDAALAVLPDGTLANLLVGWHLAWTGESVYAEHPPLTALCAQTRYSVDDRRLLLTVGARVLGGLLRRYRDLAERGVIELSMSPYQHALLPLLLDFAAAREARPELPLPEGAYPGGAQRVRWQLEQGRVVFEALLGQRPCGCWPAEGALSEAALAAIAGCGYAWTASSEAVLKASLGRARTDALPQSHYALRGAALKVFFRDDGLSDRIGFVYRDWPAEAAVADLLSRLEAAACAPQRRMALIALDGENPWAQYPANGAAFVTGLYRALAGHPRLRPATLGELSGGPWTESQLPPLRAGSWVGGELTTWIGHPAKNRLWSELVAAKQRYDARPSPTPELQRLLGVCEASDWFWWAGSTTDGRDAGFGSLFREHLAALRAALG